MCWKLPWQCVLARAMMAAHINAWSQLCDEAAFTLAHGTGIEAPRRIVAESAPPGPGGQSPACAHGGVRALPHVPYMSQSLCVGLLVQVYIMMFWNHSFQSFGVLGRMHLADLLS